MIPSSFGDHPLQAAGDELGAAHAMLAGVLIGAAEELPLHRERDLPRPLPVLRASALARAAGGADFQLVEHRPLRRRERPVLAPVCAGRRFLRGARFLGFARGHESIVLEVNPRSRGYFFMLRAGQMFTRVEQPQSGHGQ